MKLVYQHNYSELEPRMLSFHNRQQKAQKIVAIISNFVNHAKKQRPKDLICLEVGCAAGMMTNIFGNSFKAVVGVDIDRQAIAIAKRKNRKSIVSFKISDALKLPFKKNCFDLVICNNVYEHVPDPNLMMAEIWRVLRDNGFCYFAGPNKYAFLEPHYSLPCLSWFPKQFGSLYLKMTGKGDYYYETLLSQKQLRKLASKFKITDYTVEVLKKPLQFHASHHLQKPFSYLPRSFISLALPFLPSFFWILTKK
ncbi:hypothetical protein COU97_00875 [Candidatus Shapirobacteria bacterium CG10_big_fil_rev_8_21_14_0_10_48_15]|uniref:Methyltransferase type 11 domain-containing protein n=1 Tax=Candidatus Shapirobacteria bacterium CG10_big_fil_rev_8_21_14_0_10_48_15 TaxID=1974484 RepID=A0A2M8L7J9_9BACT|nr:MAG: hypothetical protein COU97_00875 [Candidatus Shapirobacteria bacterium CG10_big_fil_rev_8_21_14_0_10_48_15]